MNDSIATSNKEFAVDDKSYEYLEVIIDAYLEGKAEVSTPILGSKFYKASHCSPFESIDWVRFYWRVKPE